MSTLSNLTGYSPWGHKESNKTEVTSHAHMHTGYLFGLGHCPIELRYLNQISQFDCFRGDSMAHVKMEYYTKKTLSSCLSVECGTSPDSLPQSSSHSHQPPSLLKL